MPLKKVFFAYPSTQAEVMQAISGAGRLVATRGQDIELRLWVENDIAGRPLTDPIFEEIIQSDILFADVTTVGAHDNGRQEWRRRPARYGAKC